MPKETSRTKKIKAVLERLISEKSDWEPKALRAACLASFALTDAAERQKYHDSIRYLVAQMKKSGALGAKVPAGHTEADAFVPPSKPTEFEILVTDEPTEEMPSPEQTAPKKLRERKARGAKRAERRDARKNSFEPKPAEEAAAPEAAPLTLAEPPALPEAASAVSENDREGSAVETAVGKEAEPPALAVKVFRGPKGKDMKLYLAELLSYETALAENAIFTAAVRRFGAEGERVNGVGGLAKQQLREGVKEGWLVGSPKEGYRLAPKREESEPAAPAAPQPESAPEAAQEPLPPAPVLTEEQAPAEPKPLAPASALPPRARARRAAAARPLRKTPEPLQKEISAPKLGAPLNEMRFAELLSKRQQSLQKQTGDNTFFAEFSARLLEAHFRARGLTVTGRFVVDGADDKGADVILHTVDELGIADVVLLQAKTRTVGQVTLKELREFFGVMSSQRATRGIFITTSSFTTDAVTFIRENPSLGAIDKYKLFDLARAYGVGILRENGACIPDPSIFS